MTIAQGSLEKKTVLIVEDQALMRSILLNFVTAAFPGVTFLQAKNGRTALELCTSFRPHLVLMDVCLPDVNGIELTARLKAQWPGIEVIVISIHKESVYSEQALEAGAFAFVAKDAIHQELLPHFADALGLAPHPAASGATNGANP